LQQPRCSPPGASRRERLDSTVSRGLARLEEARTRIPAVDAALAWVRRERPVAVGILAAALAFRLFALLLPVAYVIVVGLGIHLAANPGSAASQGAKLKLADVVADSVAAAARTSGRDRWTAILVGGVALVLASSGVVSVLHWVHVLAWQVRPIPRQPCRWLVPGLIAGVAVVAGAAVLADQVRAASLGLKVEVGVALAALAIQAVLWLVLSWMLPHPAVRWTAMLSGALLFAGGFQAFHLLLAYLLAPRVARAPALYGSLGMSLVLLVALFLFGRLAVASAELNAALWERRQPDQA
jgi:uncharacterized BrkB/YihY/UPF0761 family membrane protein